MRFVCFHMILTYSHALMRATWDYFSCIQRASTASRWVLHNSAESSKLMGVGNYGPPFSQAKILFGSVNDRKLSVGSKKRA